MAISRNVLITGSSTGIGAATARILAKQGDKVFIHGEQQADIDKVIADCNKLSPHGYKMVGMVLDLEEPTNGEVLVNNCVAAYGGLDVLICNAGQYDRTAAGEPECWKAFKKTFDIHLYSHVNATLAAVPHLRKRPEVSTVIYIAAAAHDKPSKTQFAYSTASAATIQLGKSMAVELAPIRVNVVSPGPVKTPIFGRYGYSTEEYDHITLLGRLGEADEVAKVIVFMASSEPSFCTGANVMCDGGFTIQTLGLDPIPRKK